MTEVSNIEVIKYILFKEHYNRPLFMRTNFRIFLCAIVTIYFLKCILFYLPIIYYNLFAESYDYDTGVCHGHLCLDNEMKCWKEAPGNCYVISILLIILSIIITGMMTICFLLVRGIYTRACVILGQMNGQSLWVKIHRLLSIKYDLPYVIDSNFKILIHMIIIIIACYRVPHDSAFTLFNKNDINYETGECIAKYQSNCPIITCWKGNYYGCQFYSVLITLLVHIVFIMITIIGENIFKSIKSKLTQIKYDILTGTN